MPLLRIHILVTIVLLLGVSSSASAVIINATSNYDGVSVVFHVISVGDGLGEINLVINSQNSVALADGTILDGSVVLNGSFGVITPEPTTALLVGLGLAGLSAVKRCGRI